MSATGRERRRDYQHHGTAASSHLLAARRLGRRLEWSGKIDSTPPKTYMWDYAYIVV
jgi:hypothetical protein